MSKEPMDPDELVSILKRIKGDVYEWCGRDGEECINDLVDMLEEADEEAEDAPEGEGEEEEDEDEEEEEDKEEEGDDKPKKKAKKDEGEE